jgi:hypothetical protein
MPESKREIIANVARLHQYMDRHRHPSHDEPATPG